MGRSRSGKGGRDQGRKKDNANAKNKAHADEKDPTPDVDADKFAEPPDDAADRNAGQKKPGAAGENLRFQTLTRLESVLRLLVERHGARRTLGEMLAVTAGMARLCKQDRVSIAEIADATGLPKQNLSRWAQKRIGDSIFLRVNADDQRIHDVLMLDPERGQENIERLAKILGISNQD